MTITSFQFLGFILITLIVFRLFPDSRLAGMYLPGKYCLLQRVDSHFHKPVYIGDLLTVSGFIKKKVEMGHTLVITAEIKNQNGDVVSSAKTEAGCLK